MLTDGDPAPSTLGSEMCAPAYFPQTPSRNKLKMPTGVNVLALPLYRLPSLLQLTSLPCGCFLEASHDVPTQTPTPRNLPESSHSLLPHTQAVSKSALPAKRGESNHFSPLPLCFPLGSSYGHWDPHSPFSTHTAAKPNQSPAKSCLCSKTLLGPCSPFGMKYEVL